MKGTHLGRLSSFDIPQSASSEYNEKTQEVTIQFKYLTSSEPVSRQRFEQRDASFNVVLLLGRHSRKLYGIVISGVSPQQIPDVKIEIQEAIDSVKNELSAKKPEDLVPMLNLQATRQFLTENKELFAFS